MQFDSEQTPAYWRPSQIFGGLNRFPSARRILTPTEYAQISGIPEDNIDRLIRDGELETVPGLFPGFISREAGFIFQWNFLLKGIKEASYESK